MSTWRIGKRVPLNVYEDDRPVCQCHTAVDAARIAAAMNRAGHVVLLEALKHALPILIGAIAFVDCKAVVAEVRAAIKQAERGQ